MVSSEYRTLIEELKIALRARGVTYGSLAKQLRMSEANVKKIFNKRDGKISTLAVICDKLGFTFFDLVNWSAVKKVKISYFSDVQDEFFAKNFDHYVFFNQLVIRRKQINEIESEFALTKQTLRKYLKSLEKLGIIEIRTDGTPKILMKEPIGLRKTGKLRKILQENFARSVMDHQFGKFVPESMRRLETREWLLRKESFERFYQEFLELISVYDQVSARDHSIAPKEDMTLVSFLMGILLDRSPYSGLQNERF